MPTYSGGRKLGVQPFCAGNCSKQTASTQAGTLSLVASGLQKAPHRACLSGYFFVLSLLLGRLISSKQHSLDRLTCLTKPSEAYASPRHALATQAHLDAVSSVQPADLST